MEAFFWIRDEAVVVRDEGQQVALQGIMVDITQSKQMEEELREHRNYLGDMAEKRTDSLMSANKSFRQYIDELELAKAELTKVTAVRQAHRERF